MSSDYGETTLLNEDDYNETTILSADNGGGDYNETTILSADNGGGDYNETTILSADNGGGDYNETTILSADNGGGDYNETTILSAVAPDYDGYNETTLLCAGDPIPANTELFGIQNIITGEWGRITKTPFVLGSEQGNVDMLVNNPTVSRHHAEIMYVDGKYYLVDKKSTNGTTLDGVVLEPEKPVLLYNGALIQLSEELFQFTMIGGQK